MNDDGVENLVEAHQQIINAWYAAWIERERKRIDEAFARAKKRRAGEGAMSEQVEPCPSCAEGWRNRDRPKCSRCEAEEFERVDTAILCRAFGLSVAEAKRGLERTGYLYRRLASLPQPVNTAEQSKGTRDE